MSKPGLTVQLRGHERSALVVRGRTTVAEVFTDLEPGDQYENAAEFAAAAELRSALDQLLGLVGDQLDAGAFGNAGVELLAFARAASSKASGQSAPAPEADTSPPRKVRP